MNEIGHKRFVYFSQGKCLVLTVHSPNRKRKDGTIRIGHYSHVESIKLIWSKLQMHLCRPYKSKGMAYRFNEVSFFLRYPLGTVLRKVS